MSPREALQGWISGSRAGGFLHIEHAGQVETAYATELVALIAAGPGWGDSDE
jgi:hypothetical protein